MWPITVRRAGKRGSNRFAHPSMKRSTASRISFRDSRGGLAPFACPLLSFRFCIPAQAAAVATRRKAEIASSFRGLKATATGIRPRCGGGEQSAPPASGWNTDTAFPHHGLKTTATGIRPRRGGGGQRRRKAGQFRRACGPSRCGGRGCDSAWYSSRSEARW